MRWAVIVLSVLALAGCVGGRNDARQDAEAAAAKYQDCVAGNPMTPHKCEGLKPAQ